jgi:hypothetical protein
LVNKIEIDGHYLIIAPKPGLGMGNHQMLSECEFLEINIENFLRNYPEILRDTITIYELKKVEID